MVCRDHYSVVQAVIAYLSYQRAHRSHYIVLLEAVIVLVETVVVRLESPRELVGVYCAWRLESRSNKVLIEIMRVRTKAVRVILRPVEDCQIPFRGRESDQKDRESVYREVY